MTKRDILAVAIKVYGIVVLARAIVEAPMMIYYSFQFFRIPPRVTTNLGHSPWGNALSMLSSVILTFAVGWILLACADAIAGFLVPGDAQVPALSVVGQERPTFVLASRVVGVVMLGLAVPALAGAIASMVASYRSMGMSTVRFNPPLWQGQCGALASGVAYALVGIYLLLGARHLVQWAFGEPTAPAPDQG